MARYYQHRAKADLGLKPGRLSVSNLPDMIHQTCQWLEGEPKARNFCGDPVQPGSPYCPDHHAWCYVQERFSRRRAA